jgi:hypothetical protein
MVFGLDIGRGAQIKSKAADSALSKLSNQDFWTQFLTAANATPANPQTLALFMKEKTRRMDAGPEAQRTLTRDLASVLGSQPELRKVAQVLVRPTPAALRR